jgi:hypothetical protein
MSTMTAVKERPILFSGAMVRAILEGRKTQTRRVVRDQPPAHMDIAVPYLKPDDGPQQWCFTGPQLDATGKPLPIEQWEGGWPDCSPAFVCPYGVPGDRLWVRETLGVVANWGTVQYAADSAYLYDPDMRKAGFPYADECEAMVEHWGDDYNANDFKLIPSIFMPRWASRITLELTDVRVQRVQEISEEDAQSEGAFFTNYGRKCFHGNGVHDVGDCPAPPKTHPQREGWSMSETTSHEQCLGKPRFAFANLWDSINADRGFGWDKNPWVWALTFRRLP